MILDRYEKQPGERKDYDIDYADWLSASGDTLDEVSTLVAEHPGVPGLSEVPLDSLTVDTTEMTATRLKLWISGGEDGKKYKITITVTTVGGRIDESEVIFTVKDR